MTEPRDHETAAFEPPAPTEVEPPVSFSRRTAFRFAAGAAGVAAVAATGAAGATPAAAQTGPHPPECMADLQEGN